MIVCGDIPLAVGQVYRGQLTDITREWQEQPFFVLREATEAEYIEQMRALQIDGPINQHPYYYLVTTD